MDWLAGQPHEHLEYCSQRCLSTLVRGRNLDPLCRNYRRHKELSGPTEAHPLGIEDFINHLSRQLQFSSHGYTHLTGRSARVAKVTLLEYGYVFIAKATPRETINEQLLEQRAYARLRAIQGTHVPVWLGHIDLVALGKEYDHRDTKISDLWLMSHAGIPAEKTELGKPQLLDMAKRAVSAVHGEGVLHRDLDNLDHIRFNLQLDEAGLLEYEAMIIDFTTACFVEEGPIDGIEPGLVKSRDEVQTEFAFEEAGILTLRDFC